MATTVKLGISFDGFYSLQDSLDIARKGVAAGAQSLWMAEHLGYRDPIGSSMAFALSCPGATIVPTAISPYIRHPTTVAMSMATLAEAAPGNVALAVGTGNPMFLAESGLAIDKPIRVMREYVASLRHLLSGEAVTHTDMLYTFAGARLAFTPPSPIPIYLCPMKPQMLRLSGRIADGLCLSAGLSAGFVAHSLSLAVEGAQEAGRPASAVHKAGYVYFLASSTPKGGYDTLAARLAFLMRNRYIDDNLLHSGIPIDQTAIMAAISARDFETARRLVPDEAVEAFAITGTADQCLDGIARFAAAGLEEIVLVLAGDEAERELGYRVIQDAVANGIAGAG